MRPIQISPNTTVVLLVTNGRLGRQSSPTASGVATGAELPEVTGLAGLADSTLARNHSNGKCHCHKQYRSAGQGVNVVTWCMNMQG